MIRKNAKHKDAQTDLTDLRVESDGSEEQKEGLEM